MARQNAEKRRTKARKKRQATKRKAKAPNRVGVVHDPGGGLALAMLAAQSMGSGMMQPREDDGEFKHKYDLECPWPAAE